MTALRCLVHVAFAVAAVGCASIAPTTRDDDVVALVKERLPGATVGEVRRMEGLPLYEVLVEDRLVYVDDRVRYIFAGSVFDAQTRRDLTAPRLAAVQGRSFETLPADIAIRTVRGDGSRRIAVFSDIDCPYCRQLETVLAQLDDVTIDTYLFPIDELHPDAARKSALIWCAPDRAVAWAEYFRAGKLPATAPPCSAPIDTMRALGEKFGVSGTPALVFEDGTVIPGLMPRDRIEAALRRAHGEASASRTAAASAIR